MTPDQIKLEPIEPRTARKLYLDYKKTCCTEATVRGHYYRTQHLVNWCDEVGIDNLNDITGRHLHEFRLWHMERGDINQLTLRQHMCTLRVFLKWAASIDAVSPNLYDKVIVPQVGHEERARDELLDAETTKSILDYFSRYHFASRNHVLFAVLWETGIRIGALKSIDVGDVHLDAEYIDLVHRPDRGTTLKNGFSGERPVAITSTLAELIEDYLDTNWVDVIDDYGRHPLFTSENGRLGRSSIRRIVYRITAPLFSGTRMP